MYYSILAALALLASASSFMIAPAVSSSNFISRALPSAESRLHATQPTMLFGGGGDKKAGEKAGGGMNMGNMMESLKKANEIGAKTKALQEELEKLNIEGVSSNGKVKVFVTGQQMPCGCEIDASLMSEGAEAVQEAVVEAAVAAHKESLVQMSKKLSELYQDMGLPMGMMGQK